MRRLLGFRILDWRVILTTSSQRSIFLEVLGKLHSRELSSPPALNKLTLNCSGVLSFGIKGGAEAGSQVVDNFKIISNLAKYVVPLPLDQSYTDLLQVWEMRRPLQSIRG